MQSKQSTRKTDAFFGLADLPKAVLESRIDSILQSQDLDDLIQLDSELGRLIGSANKEHAFHLYYRWAITAERLGHHSIAFDRWLQAHGWWPENEWFLSRCFEVGIFVDRWAELLPLVRPLMPHLVRRGGILPDSWGRAITRLCLKALTSPSNEADTSIAALRELISAQMLIESSRLPKDLIHNCLAADLLDLEPTDSEGLKRAYNRIKALIPSEKLAEMPPTAILLYLMTCGRNPRPDLDTILRDNLNRLGLIHLEMIFGLSANCDELPRLTDDLEQSLAGVILCEMARVLQSESQQRDPKALVSKLKRLLQTTDAGSHGNEARFAEHWHQRLVEKIRPSQHAHGICLNQTRPLAVCIYGQMRGFRRVQENWKQFFTGVDYDVYVSTWRKGGRRELHVGPNFSDRVLPPPLALAFDQMCAKYSVHTVREHYPTLLEMLSDSDIISEEILRSTYPQLVYARIDDDEEPAYRALSTQEKMHMRGFSALELCQASGRRYERVLRIRPDLPVLEGTMAGLMTHEELSMMNDDIVWSDGKQRLDYRYGFMMGDRVTLGTPLAVQRFCSIWHKRHLANPGMSGMENSMIAHRTIGFHTLVEGIQVSRLPVQFGIMLDPPAPPTDEMRAAIMADAQGRMDEVDEVFLEALNACET